MGSSVGLGAGRTVGQWGSDLVIGPAPLHLTLLAVSAVLTTALGLYAFRNRAEPGATAFVVLMAVLANWSVSYGIGLLTTGESWRVFWMRMVWISTGTIEVWLLLFALAYTGHDEFVTRRTVAGLLVFPAVVIAATWTNHWHHLFWTDHNFVVRNGMVIEHPGWGPLFWAEVVHTYLLVAVAAALLLRLIYQSDYLYTDQSALLLVGIAVPFVTSVVDVFALTNAPAIDPTPYAFTITGFAFAYALFRRQLFDLVPATRQLGRDAAIRQLDAGVVIVDNANRIVYCNEAAEEVLDCDAADAVGRDVELLVDESRLDFDTEDALAEVERYGNVYEIRTSPITDRNGRRIGNTLVVHDVTARKRRVRQLADHRDELSTLNDLNAVIRGVNQALVSAVGREEIERTVCERVADADLYERVVVADLATWRGEADRWTVAGDEETSPSPPAIDDTGFRRTDGGQRGNGAAQATDGEATQTTDGETAQATDGEAIRPLVPGVDDGEGTWTVVPLVYGRTVYGALGLYTERSTVSDRERSILGELGETIGHAINAVETQQLLSAESLVEIELACRDGSDPLVAVTTTVPCRVELEGVIPSSEEGPVAYLRVSDSEVGVVSDAFADVTDDSVRIVSETADGDSGGLLEWQLTGDAPLGALVDHGAHVHSVGFVDDAVHYEFDIASGTDARVLVDHLRNRFEDIQVLSKREKSASVEVNEVLPQEPFEDITDRQEEVLRAAYQSGYFEWPRDSNAEEVADALGISSPTLHSHLRKAEQSVLSDLFERSGRDADESES
ncbi:histidine kinase N-terminal 7TM domain-containing protein [Halosimplex pelagicum]|uniref:Helix-turn-helix domain-containing protein n=1 Tax=Halosimplex pelagicum TaxID=869886 RepID=A0A7D5P626_9EURY|nr:histidine kinase N-terminal 7TM domain-containing protein [Halosimplex pelagicum]QLH81706.1 helix-turn-helix domain-containing protein [Halosimplex pelagicum]